MSASDYSGKIIFGDTLIQWGRITDLSLAGDAYAETNPKLTFPQSYSVIPSVIAIQHDMFDSVGEYLSVTNLFKTGCSFWLGHSKGTSAINNAMIYWLAIGKK